jgi:Raf kinase inhibitor-like YbhB/YbcL family protein
MLAICSSFFKEGVRYRGIVPIDKDFLECMIGVICEKEGDMKISSPQFVHKGKIPSKFSCDGANINPELHFEEVPAETISLVLIMDDPDVPKSLRADGMYDHWVVYNIPPHVKKIEENKQPPGIQGKNTAGAQKYTGPCPPDREHRYFFKLYALDKMLDLPAGATKKEVEKAMEGHLLAKAELMGTYVRPSLIVN